VYTVTKVATFTGSSPESFAKAAEAALADAVATTPGITGGDVVRMSVKVENDRIAEFRTTVHFDVGGSR
jgi:flavin-binding protein dodecin